MSGGWYKQHRNLTQRPWFKDPSAVQLYIYLKERAYVRDSQYNGNCIRRGSCPITRPELMEVTGMSYAKLDRELKKLISYGDIIVRANNRFSVVSVCDYDRCGIGDTLFPTADDTTGDTADDTTGDTAFIYEEEYKNKDSLIRAYKTERENKDAVVEIKNRYNKVFDSKLPPCIRLTMPTRLMVTECINRYGAASVDIVFDQILNEPFSLGANKTGFIARFQTIFEPKQYQGYLERAQLRKQKKLQPQPESQQKKVGVIETPKAVKMSRYDYLMNWIKDEAAGQTKIGQEILLAAYTNGELQKLGINWKPNNN